MHDVIASKREINSSKISVVATCLYIATVVMAIDALFTRRSRCTTFVVRYFTYVQIVRYLRAQKLKSLPPNCRRLESTHGK